MAFLIKQGGDGKKTVCIFYVGIFLVEEGKGINVSKVSSGFCFSVVHDG